MRSHLVENTGRISLSEDNGLPLHCVVCHASLSPTSLADCPRCGTDNRAWYAWAGAGRRAHLKRFFLDSPWGRLALVSLLLPPVTWAASGIQLASIETAIFILSLALGIESLLLLYIQRETLWLSELARGAASRFRPGLLALGGMGHLIFIGVGLAVAREWMSGPGEIDVTGYADAWSAGVIVALALAFTGQALGMGLSTLYAYGRWRLRTFSAPIFVDETRLLELVLRSVKPRIQVKTNNTYEAVTEQVVSLRRTAQAGLSLKIRAEAGTDHMWEGRSLTAVQHWRAVSDRWGHVIQLSQEGPLEYVPDFTTLPGADTAPLPAVRPVRAEESLPKPT